MAAKVKAADVAQGQALGPWTYTVTRQDLVAYANASGDQNPIHQNEEFAKQVGLPDVIAHGMHTMAKMGQFVTDWAGDPGAVTRFKTRFTAMVPVSAADGNQVTVSATVTGVNGSTAALEVQAALGDGTVVGKGDADVALA